MHLSRIIIKNYRSIEYLDLSLEKGKNVIVGKNNSGKSNIIKAIDLILGDSNPDWAKSENITEGDFYTFQKKAGEKTESVISSEIFIWCELTRDGTEPLNYDEISRCRGYFRLVKNKNWKPFKYEDERIAMPDFSESAIAKIFEHDIDDAATFDKQKRAHWVDSKLTNQVKFQDELDNKFHFAFSFRAQRTGDGIKKELRFLYKEAKSNDWVLAFTAPVRNELLRSAIIPSFRDPQSQLKISSWSWYGKLLKNYVDSGNPKLRAAFEEVKKASTEVFEQLQEKINHSKAKIAFPNTAISFQFNPESKQDVYKSALIYVDDGFNSLLQEKGSGIQSAVIIGLFDFYTREIAHSGSSLLAIEEPELFLHPHGRRVISDRLDDFLDNGKNQVIVTTHSSEFISSVGTNLNVIVVSKQGNGTKAKNTFFKEPKEVQILIKTQNNEMFFADKVVLVEGGDKYLLEVISVEYGLRKGVEGNWFHNDNISVVNVNGKTEFSKYVQKLNEVGIPAFVLTDFDFIRNGLSEFLTCFKHVLLRDKVNELKGKICTKLPKDTRFKCLSDLPEEFRHEIQQLIPELRKLNIYVLENELENYYTVEGKKVGAGLSKEQTPIAIASECAQGEKASKFIDVNEFDILLLALRQPIQEPLFASQV